VASTLQSKIEVKLIRESTIRIVENSHSISQRGLGRVALFLVFLRGSSATRNTMARQLWPEEPDEVAFNRLRVSLNRLKSLFGDALVVNRSNIRLLNATVSVDLFERLTQLQELLDEVDQDYQLQRLTSFSEDIRYVGWREFSDVDPTGVLREWEQVCRTCITRMMQLAVQAQEWKTVDFAWEIMCDRGDLDSHVCEHLMDSYARRDNIDEGLHKVRVAFSNAGVPESGSQFKSLKTYSQSLRDARKVSPRFQTSHFHLFGSAILGQVERHPESLGALIAIPEVQLHMQAFPTEYLDILDAISHQLEVGSPTWVETQVCRLYVYGSLYANTQVLEISKSLFTCDMPLNRQSVVWMIYSFSLFHLRRWEEALESAEKAQQFAIQGGDIVRSDVCSLSTGSYLWHLGRVDEAKEIYDAYLEKYKNSEDFTVLINAAICHSNYAIIEFVYGDINKAKKHIDFAYGERTRLPLARAMPPILAEMAVIYARLGEVNRGVECAVESLKLTYSRNSSREGQLNMEWVCGVLVVGGMKEEAWQVMRWANEWRNQTLHTRSICEQKFAADLGLQEFDGSDPLFSATDEYRDVLRFLIRCLRRVQKDHLQVASSD
jgi:tetratricopeptide (TPR) repeat protein